MEKMKKVLKKTKNKKQKRYLKCFFGVLHCLKEKHKTHVPLRNVSTLMTLLWVSYEIVHLEYFKISTLSRTSVLKLMDYLIFYKDEKTISHMWRTFSNYLSLIPCILINHTLKYQSSILQWQKWVQMITDGCILTPRSMKRERRGTGQ